jgi:hypothetical protein
MRTPPDSRAFGGLSRVRDRENLAPEAALGPDSRRNPRQICPWMAINCPQIAIRRPRSEDRG